MNTIVKIFGGKDTVKKFEKFVRDNKKAKNFFIKNLSNYNAYKVGYLRWATTDPTGRQALYFKKRSGGGSELVYDSIGEIISTIWYSLFLENRAYYLTERVWQYMEKKSISRGYFIFNFDGVKRTAPATKSSENKNFTFPSSFLRCLGKKSEIRDKLILKVKDIKNRELPRKLREVSADKKIFELQQNGIENALSQWLKKEALGMELNECFKLFYPKETQGLAKPFPIFKYELASKFLFMFQNIAIFCPVVKVLHLFAYTAVNGRKKSSLTFFLKETRNHLDWKSRSREIFDILCDIESAVPDIPSQKRHDDVRNYPLWNSAFNRLREKKEEKKEEKQIEKTRARK